MREEGAPPDPAWERYERLNAAIGEEVFGEGAAGRPVYLDLEPDMLVRIARRMDEAGRDAEELLVETVRPTLCDPAGARGVFSAHTTGLLLWEFAGRTSPPPCIAVLAVLSLVAARMERTEEFAVSNYHGRLLRTLGIDDWFGVRVGRDFRAETPPLWNALNAWLEDQDGRRGLPTAVAFDRRRYVGLPLSQALVRVQDRARLPVLFAQFGLQPGQRISVQGMRELLAEWMPVAHVTPSLKNLWKKATNKERIAEVACAELQGWDGALPEELRPAEHRLDDNLFLAAELRAHPRPVLELLLVGRRAGAASRPLALRADASRGAEAALGRLGGAMRLEPLPGSSWASVEPGDLVSFPELLFANASLEAPDGAVWTRRARQLLLLKRHEADHLFVEARRAELLEAYLVLVVSELAAPVREALASCARKGWREAGREDLPGLPPGWSAFLDVQLERVADGSSDDLAPLRPVAHTHLVLGGGLPLPGMHVWHSGRLPELRVVADEHGGAVRIRAVPTRHLDEDRPLDAVALAEVEASGVVDLSRVPELADGDFRIVVDGPSGGTLATAGLRARSANWPRSLEPEQATRVGHPVVGGHLAPYGGGVGDADGGAVAVVGARLENAGCAIVEGRGRGRLPPLPERPGVLVEDAEQDDWSLAETAAATAGELPVCFRRRYHHWLCDERQGNKPVYSICKDCGREKWWELKRKRRTKRRKADAGPYPAEHATHPRLPAIGEDGGADMDLVLDALSYAGAGSWRSLCAILGPVGDAPWFAHEAARRLEALGHVGIGVDPASLAPVRWRVAPPTLVVPESGPCFLAGARSARLVDAVAGAVEELDGELLVVAQPDGPGVVEIRGLGPDDLALVVDDVSTYRRLELALSVRPAARIAALLPPLGSVRAALPALTTSAERCERLDLDRGRWRPAERMDLPGAYRLGTRPRVYAVVPAPSAGGGRTVIADARLAKHLAAREASVASIGYDESGRALLASAGAPLPGLFERAAVLCSGRLPTRCGDGTLVYGGVPPEVAQAVWAAWAGADRSRTVAAGGPV